MISLSNVRLQLEFSLIYMGFPVAQMVKNVPAMRETWVRSLGWEDPWIGKIPGLGRSLDWEDPLEKGTATHSGILAWRIPWTIQSMVSQRVGQD